MGIVDLPPNSPNRQYVVVKFMADKPSQVLRVSSRQTTKNHYTREESLQDERQRSNTLTGNKYFEETEVRQREEYFKNRNATILRENKKI